MSKKDKALKLALEALEMIAKTEYHIETPPIESLEEKMRRIARKVIPALREALAEQPAQRKYCRGDRLICLETEEYCVIHISGTDRQWVKFPDTHIGVYKNEQLAELFELLPKEIEIEQPAQRTWVGLTDEEMDQWIEEEHDVLRWAEATLKEKNT